MANNRMPYVLQWNFSIQQTFARNFLIESGIYGEWGKKAAETGQPESG